MPVKMKFPDGTEVEGEVSEIMELIAQLKEIMGTDITLPKSDLDRHK